MTAMEIEALLHVMADDAFVVMNWARREGMKRDRQLAEVVRAFRKTLNDANARIESVAPKARDGAA